MKAGRQFCDRKSGRGRRSGRLTDSFQKRITRQGNTRSGRESRREFAEILQSHVALKDGASKLFG